MKFLPAPALEWVYRGRDFQYDVISNNRNGLDHATGQIHFPILTVKAQSSPTLSTAFE